MNTNRGGGYMFAVCGFWPFFARLFAVSRFLGPFFAVLRFRENCCGVRFLAIFTRGFAVSGHFICGFAVSMHSFLRFYRFNLHSSMIMYRSKSLDE